MKAHNIKLLRQSCKGTVFANTSHLTAIRCINSNSNYKPAVAGAAAAAAASDTVVKHENDLSHKSSESVSTSKEEEFKGNFIHPLFDSLDALLGNYINNYNSLLKTMSV
jgi:hypothetical protein